MIFKSISVVNHLFLAPFLFISVSLGAYLPLLAPATPILCPGH
jgi:hypothetical protein